MISDQVILQAAVEILNEDFSASLEVIADKAGINRKTLNRRFKDRNQLIQKCKKEMMHVCKAAMNEAYDNYPFEPLKQLEYMLYAGIDCNYKYAFLNKLQQREQPRLFNKQDKNELNDNVKIKWRELVVFLQVKEIINKELTPYWVFFLFDGMISTAVTACQSGDLEEVDVKRLAWHSFAQSIGIRL